MINHAAMYPYKDKDWNVDCDYCGCVFRLQTELQDGHNEKEEYYCPECDKEFKIRARITPTVTLISKRTDGRTGRCKSK